MRPFAERSVPYRLRSFARRIWHGALGMGRKKLAHESRSVSTETFLEVDVLDLVKEAVARHGESVHRLFRDSLYWGGGIIGSYDVIESCVLMELVRRVRPKRIVEMAPNRGYSTTLMQLAMADRDDFEHRSYDIDDYQEDILYTANRHGGLKNWSFNLGDFRKLLGEGDHREFLQAADIFFIDADHSRAFGEWYVRDAALLDDLAPGALIHIHDMYPTDTEGRRRNPEADPVFAWIDTKQADLEVLFNYEMCRAEELQSQLPRWVFFDHVGEQGNNPSLWLKLKTTRG